MSNSKDITPENSKPKITVEPKRNEAVQIETTQDIILRERSTQMFLTSIVAKSEDWLKSKLSKESSLYKKSLCPVKKQASQELFKKQSLIKKRKNRKSIAKNKFDADANADCLKPGSGILLRAQNAEQTLTGMFVLKGTVNQIVTLERQERMKANPFTPNKIRMILESPFCDMSVITSHLGLTGLGGIVLDRFEVFEFPVKCIISVTYESPLFNVEGIETYRVPVADDKREKLSIYFEEVTDKIEEIKQAKAVTIVHCMAGVSRSASIVMAYLIRYEKMSLRGAFNHVKSRRSVVTPNTSFLEQLVAFETKCRDGQQQTKLIDHTINGVTQRLPDFIIEEWLNDYLPYFETE